MTQENSTIRYSLRENKLQVPNAPAYVAQVRGYKTVTRAQLVNIMANANTTVSRQDIIVVLDLLENAVKEQLLNGNNVVTNLFASRVSIKGGFEALNAEYEKGVHKVKVNLSASAGLRKYVDHNAVTFLLQFTLPSQLRHRQMLFYYHRKHAIRFRSKTFYLLFSLNALPDAAVQSITLRGVPYNFTRRHIEPDAAARSKVKQHEVQLHAASSTTWSSMK